MPEYKCPGLGLIYHILNRPVTVLEAKFTIDEKGMGVWVGFNSIECIPGININDVVERISREFDWIQNEFNRFAILLTDGRLEEAKAVARRLEEALGLSGVFTSIVKRMRRGVRVTNLYNEARLVNEEFMRRVYRELAGKYTVLDAGKYALVTNGPPGIYKLPESPVEVDNLLASLGLGVVVRESIDIDVVFSNILRTANSDYARVLLEAYMRLKGLSIEDCCIKPWLIPMIVKSLEAGHLVIIRGNRIYEYPNIIINQDNALEAFIGLIGIGWI